MVATASWRVRTVRRERGAVAGIVTAARTVAGMLVHGGRERISEIVEGGRMRMGAARGIQSGVEAVGQAARLTLRSMRRRPALAVGVVAAFAIGIGANATIYRLTDRLLLSPPAELADPGSLRVVAVESYSDYLGRRNVSPLHTYASLEDWRGAQTLTGVAGYDFAVRERTIGRGDGVWRLRTQGVTGGFFALLGVRPVIGRLIQPADDHPGAARVIVLSEDVWRDRFGGSPSVLGETVDWGTGPHEVVGVAPTGFTGPELRPVDAWVAVAPYRSQLGEDWRTNRRRYWLRVVARLAPGASEAGAVAELTTRHRAGFADLMAEKQHPPEPKVVLASLIPGESPLRPTEVDVAKWLVGVSLTLLLLACLNVAYLLVAGQAGDRRSTAVRRAIGASRRRVGLTAAVQSVTLALIGGAAALAVAVAAAGPLSRLLLPNFDWSEAGLGWEVAGLSAALAIGAGVLAGALPALFVARTDALGALLRSGVPTRDAKRTRAVLLGIQVALSVLLLTGAGLFLRSFQAAAVHDLGVDLEHVYLLSLDLDPSVPETDRPALLRRAFEEVSAHPGVDAAAVAATYPLFQKNGAPLRAEGLDSIPQMAAVSAVGGRYFETVGLRTLRGRPLSEEDRAGASRVAVVSAHMAELYWQGDALDRCLYIGPDEQACTRVVGVMEDVRGGGFGADPWVQYYVPAVQQAPAGDPFLVLARFSARPTATLLRDLSRDVMAGDPRIRFVELDPARSMLDGQLRPWRLGATLFTVFGGLALLLAMIGLYAALDFEILQRWREMGIRAALGAPGAGIVRAVVAQSALVVATGAAAGTLAAFLLAPPLRDLLFDIPARDPWSFLAAAGVLILAAGAAALAPARRAVRVDPVEALRQE